MKTSAQRHTIDSRASESENLAVSGVHSIRRLSPANCVEDAIRDVCELDSLELEEIDDLACEPCEDLAMLDELDENDIDTIVGEVVEVFRPKSMPALRAAEPTRRVESTQYAQARAEAELQIQRARGC
jgi:hypothetical protein